MVTRSIEIAQRKVEAHNFDIRKQLLEYDDVANDQRKVIYEQRNELLESRATSRATIADAARRAWSRDLFRAYVPPESVEEQWDVPAWRRRSTAELQLRAAGRKPGSRRSPSCDEQALLERIVAEARAAVPGEDPALAPSDALHQYERYVMLQILDPHWREHLAALDHLRQGIHLRGYAQKNPKQEYKREAFELFGAHARDASSWR